MLRNFVKVQLTDKDGKLNIVYTNAFYDMKIKRQYGK